MSVSISVIIPTLNVAHSIGPTLDCLAIGVEKSLICEVIFTDGGSDDAINDVASKSGAKVISSPKGRGSQLDAGAKIAKGHWLLFIHADTILSPNWASVMVLHINSHKKAAYCNLAFDKHGFAPYIIARAANLRSYLFGLPYGDQSLLISKELYEETGGYPCIPLMEDVAIAKRLRRRLTALPITATTRSDRYEQDGWFTRSYKNLGTLILYFTGVSPDELVKRYRR